MANTSFSPARENNILYNILTSSAVNVKRRRTISFVSLQYVNLLLMSAENVG